MRIAHALVSARSSRRKLLTIGTFVVGALAAYETAQLIIANDFAGMAYAAIAIGGVAIVVAILNNWRNGIYFLLGWLLFEDFVRKFSGNNMAIYFAKDCLAFVVYISFLAAIQRRKAPSFRPPFLVPLLIFVWFGLFQIFNPGSTSIWFGLMGFKIYFYYVPLLFVGYAFIDSEARLHHFLRFNVFLVLIIVSLGAAQAILGPSFLNPGTTTDELPTQLYRVARGSSLAYRPTSVFVSPGRYLDFVNLAWLLVLGIGGYLLLRLKRGRVLVFIALLVTAVGAFLTASRGVFMWGIINALVTSIAFIWGAPWRRQNGVIRVFRSIQRAALAIGLGIALLFFVYPDEFLSRLTIYQDTLLPNSPTSELAHRTWDYPIRNFLGAFDSDRWPYGYGIGTSSLGWQYVTRIFKVKPMMFGVESGFGTLVIEMGIGGLLLWILLSSAITFSACRIVKKLKGSPLLPLGFTIFWYAFFLLLPCTYAGIQAYEDFLLNAYLWLLLGVLFRLPTLTLATQPTDEGVSQRLALANLSRKVFTV